MTGGGAVAEAVGVMAEEGAAFADPETGEWVEDFDGFGDGLAFAKGFGFDLGDGLFEGEGPWGLWTGFLMKVW